MQHTYLNLRILVKGVFFFNILYILKTKKEDNQTFILSCKVGTLIIPLNGNTAHLFDFRRARFWKNTSSVAALVLQFQALLNYTCKYKFICLLNKQTLKHCVLLSWKILSKTCPPETEVGNCFSGAENVEFGAAHGRE